MKACVFLADGFETVEALAVVDVLKRAKIDTRMYSVMDSIMVKSAQDIEVKADALFDYEECSKADVIFLPGGMPGTLNLENHSGVISIIKQFYEEKKIIAAICAAPSILGHLGMLKGIRATSFGSFTDQLEGAIVTEDRVVASDNIITSRGMGTAIDLGLELVTILKGKAEADRISTGTYYSER